MTVITLAQIESAINLARSITPSVDYVLAPEVAALAELYAVMIYERLAEVDLTRLPQYQQQLLVKFAPLGLIDTCTACAAPPLASPAKATARAGTGACPVPSGEIP